MTDLAERALLPAGLRDILPPFAEREADLVARLMAVLASHGYERIKPPLIEFETSLSLAGIDPSQTFRVMDPLTQRMMAVRSDITPQVARIAATRLACRPRPLRLAYAGQVLRVQGTQLRAERQFGQVGAELIGATGCNAEAEILALQIEALAAIGLTDITVDLTLVRLVPLLLAGAPEDAALRDALDHKDVGAVSARGGKLARLLTGLIEAVGPAESALARLAALELPPAAASECALLTELVGLIRRDLPALTLTIDPVENRGLAYQGVGFTIFSPRCAGEIGRGGRYHALGEAAVGATLFMDSLIELSPEAAPTRRIFVPAGSERAAAARLRAEGWVTIAGLGAAQSWREEAARLRCAHVWRDGKIMELT